MSAARSRRANDKHNHLQRTPILVMGCSLLIACCIAFGGTNWTASAQPSEDQLPEENAIVEPGYYQETIGSYEAISQSDDDERAENLRLAAEAINGYVIEPGATFSFNEVVGDTTAERGYKEAPVLYSSGLDVGIHEVIDVARYQNEETVDAIRLHRVFFLEKI